MKNVTDFRKTVETGVDPRPKLLLNDDSESFLSNKYTSKALHQMLQTTKMNILKFQNPHFQSVLIFFKFVHLGLLLYLLCYQHSVNLCDHFCFIQLGSSFYGSTFDEIRYTAPLSSLFLLSSVTFYTFPHH